MAVYNAEAIVVRVRDFDEADKIVTLFTREEGKVQAVAKGARRPRSRFAAATQLFTHCQVQCYSGRNLDTLGQIDIVESFRLMREDLVRMAWATYICELVDEMAQERQKLEAPYLLLLMTLHLIATAGVEPEPVARAFELKLLSLLGFRPVLGECVACAGPLPAADVRFSPALGGALCNRCHGEGERIFMLSRDSLEALRHLLDGDLRRAHLLRLEPGVAAEVSRAMEHYVEWRLEKRLRSLEFLHAVVSVHR